MAILKIIPKADYDVLKKYIGIENGVVLLPEEVLNSFPTEVQKKYREIEQNGDFDYDFGGEPDVCADIVLCEDSYAHCELILGDEFD